jgi:hypothetical protein
LNGSVGYDKVTKISDNEVSIESVSNNVAAKEGFDDIKIYNVLGSVVKSESYNQVQRANINVSDLPDGIYIVEIINGTSKQQQKLIIQK